MKLRRSAGAFAALLASSSVSLAQTPPPPVKKAPIPQVEVKGSAQDYDPRRDDTASKTVLHSEEIMKYGDTNVYDVLKRAPGVTVIGNSIRMRGLGNGYTQILVNGERPPPGFSMDTLPPDQIEKIEVIRAATAEHSMQAIAGTINIVLKRVVTKAQRDVRLHGSHSTQSNHGMLTGTLADRKGQLSYYFNASLSHNEDQSNNVSRDQFTSPRGDVVQLRDKYSSPDSRGTALGLHPRLNWKFANDDQLNLSAFLQLGRNASSFQGEHRNRVGNFGVPDFVQRDNDTHSRNQFAGGELNWITKLAGGKFDMKVNVSQGTSNNGFLAFSRTEDRLTTLRRDTRSVNDYDNVGSTGKYARTLFEGHALSTGWEISRQAMNQRSSRTEGLVGRPAPEVVELFAPEVTKLAAYFQDEWNITKHWSWYQGVRWEGIRTTSAGTGLRDTRSRNHVLSPVAQTLYKFPDKSGRQLRMALTRTFKAPSTFQLSARRFEADLNSRFNPDNSGNPDLRPELADGLDLTYEHFWSPGAIFSVGASTRWIKDYIRSKLVQDTRGLWLIQPLNDGNAQVNTLDIDLKFPLKVVMANAPPIDVRANVNRNWSKVASVPGPGNRLDQQVPLSIVLGADYRTDKFNAGASFAYRRGGEVRISEEQRAILQNGRDLDAYLLYKFRPSLQLRASISNALGVDSRSQSHYADANGISESWSYSARSARVQLNVEMKF